MNKNWARLLVGMLALALVGAYFFLGLNKVLTFDFLKDQRVEARAIFDMHPWWTAGAYTLLYILTTGLSLPGATALSLAGGAIFGLWYGTILVSIASTVGATLALLVTRFLIRDWVEARFRDRLVTINNGLAAEGGYYLFSLRLIAAVPFFIINLTFGLTQFPAWRFFVISQLGMLPGTIAYVNAGTRLGELNSPSDVLTPTFVLSFAALGALPLILKRLLRLTGR